MSNYSKYLIERKPTDEDFRIKDLADSLTYEIETEVWNIIKDWEAQGELKGMSKSDKIKMLNLALKQMNLRRIV